MIHTVSLTSCFTLERQFSRHDRAVIIGALVSAQIGNNIHHGTNTPVTKISIQLPGSRDKMTPVLVA